MAYAHPSDLAPPRPSGLGGFFAELGMFLTLLGAATRVAAAVEGRRQPDAADLKALGIRDPLPGLH